MNDMPGACQSRGVTEPQREKGPARNQIIAIKNVRYGLFDERSEIFRKNLFFTKNVAFFEACKKSQTFLRAEISLVCSVIHVFFKYCAGIRLDLVLILDRDGAERDLVAPHAVVELDPRFEP